MQGRNLKFKLSEASHSKPKQMVSLPWKVIELFYPWLRDI